MPTISVETKDFNAFEEVTSGSDYRRKVSMPVYDMAASNLHTGEETGVAFTYAVGTNRITLASACTKFVVVSDQPVYMVLDSDDAAGDLAAATSRVYMLADTPWERVFTDGVTVLDFRTLVSGVTAAVRVEAYE